MTNNILVTDDSSFMRTLLSNIFKNNEGVGKIFQASNGSDALEIYKNEKIDLVTMDVDMPQMNGLESAKQIKLIDPNAKIVMVSSSKKIEDKDESEKIGVLGYITKPFDRSQINKIIENIS